MRIARPGLLFLLIILLSLLLGGCQGMLATPTPGDLYGEMEALDPSGALVVYWHALTGADEDRLLEMIDDFNASNEWDITVVGEYQGGLEALYDKIMSGLPTDELPGLVMSDPSLAAAYASQDVAVALSPYVESKEWGFTRQELEDFYPSALASDRLPQFENQLYSFPGCRSLQVLYYNLDWLKALDYDAPPRTWEEFRELACAASEPADGLFGFELGMDSSIFTSLLATQGASPLNPAGTAFTLGEEQGRAALQFLQGLIDNGCAVWETEEGTLSDFSAGNILFTIDSTAKLAPYQRAIVEGANFDWSLSHLPHSTQAPLVGVYGASTTILRSNPEDQLAAWLFVKWLAQPAQQARWAQSAACFPTRRSALEEMETYLQEHPRYALAVQLLEQEWIIEPRVAAYRACRAAIGRMLYAVTAGESVEQWFDETQSLCNQSLADEQE
jgi:multiple sugar transport system substrate-binding protein